MATKTKGRKNAFYAQSGGVTAVINASACGVIETARAHRDVIGNVYAGRNGIIGALTEDLIDTGQESASMIRALRSTPAGAFGSCRYKLKSLEANRREYERLIEVFRAHDIAWFFYNGGGDSADTCFKVSQLSEAMGYPLQAIHVPKTIDNDLRVTDHCPGFGSAAKFVAHAIMGDNQDNRSLPGIKLDVIMGRNAGWLTAASVLARQHADDGPHLVYVPERVLTIDKFVADVDRVYKQHGRCLVALSEGVHGADGKLLVESKEKDSHGNVQLSGSGALGDSLADVIKQRLGSKLRVRADTFGYLQRSFAGLASEVDAEEAREVGRAAARAALKEKAPHGSISILRNPSDARSKKKRDYSVTYVITDLHLVAKATRPLDPEFILGDEDIAPAFLDYVRPLVGKLPKTARLSDFAIDGA
jgi:6-phosphofructokinase 1